MYGVQLDVRVWGSGARTAVLVHGYSDDAGTWWRVGPALAEQGWTVLAPTLRGHGSSPRAEGYALEDFAADLVENVAVGADLVVGHSLGAVALGLAAERLRPERTVYVDPAWLRPRSELELNQHLPERRDELEASGWGYEDIHADLASNACVDVRVAEQLLAGLGHEERLTPPPALPGSLVLVPEHGALLPLAAHDELRVLGYDLGIIPGVGHVIHRDDFSAFMAALPIGVEVAG